MTGSGKTGLCLALIEEAAIDGVPVIAIDPKGDLGNLLLTFPGLERGRVPAVGQRGRRAARRARRRRVRGQGGGGMGRGSARRGARTAPASSGCGSRRSSRSTPRAAGPGGRSRSSAPSARRRPRSVTIRSCWRSAPAAPRRALLVLAGVDAPPRSREHSLVAALLTDAWQRGASLDLAVADPGRAVAAVRQGRRRRSRIVLPGEGALRLAMQLNGVLAAPGLRGLARRGAARSADAVLRRALAGRACRCSRLPISTTPSACSSCRC